MGVKFGVEEGTEEGPNFTPPSVQRVAPGGRKTSGPFHTGKFLSKVAFESLLSKEDFQV